MDLYEKSGLSGLVARAADRLSGSAAIVAAASVAPGDLRSRAQRVRDAARPLMWAQTDDGRICAALHNAADAVVDCEAGRRSGDGSGAVARAATAMTGQRPTPR